MDFNLSIGTVVNDAYIQSQIIPVEVEGYQDWTGSEYCCSHYSADGDEAGTFYKAMQVATKDHFSMWERDHEHEDVHAKIEESLRYHLEEEGIINIHKDADPLTCEWGELFRDPVITFENKDTVRQALLNAAHDVTWNLSESLQLFFQVETVLCWDGKTGKERYGADWIRDTESRLLCMTQNIKEECREQLIKGKAKLRWDSHFRRAVWYNNFGNQTIDTPYDR